MQKLRIVHTKLPQILSALCVKSDFATMRNAYKRVLCSDVADVVGRIIAGRNKFDGTLLAQTSKPYKSREQTICNAASARTRLLLPKFFLSATTPAGADCHRSSALAKDSSSTEHRIVILRQHRLRKRKPGFPSAAAPVPKVSRNSAGASASRTVSLTVVAENSSLGETLNAIVPATA